MDVETRREGVRAALVAGPLLIAAIVVFVRAYGSAACGALPAAPFDKIVEVGKCVPTNSWALVGGLLVAAFFYGLLAAGWDGGPPDWAMASAAFSVGAVVWLVLMGVAFLGTLMAFTWFFGGDPIQEFAPLFGRGPEVSTISEGRADAGGMLTMVLMVPALFGCFWVASRAYDAVMARPNGPVAAVLAPVGVTIIAGGTAYALMFIIAAMFAALMIYVVSAMLFSAMVVSAVRR